MTLDHKGGPSRNRRPSFRRAVYFKVLNSKEVVALMPRKRGKNLKQITKDQMEAFRQANIAAQYWPPHMQRDYAEAVKGTPLMPRDLLIMTMYNRFAMITLSDGRKMYPMTAVNDVSNTLDVIGQTPGDMIQRGGDGWLSIPIGTAAQILTIDPTGQYALWMDPAAGGGDYTFLDEVVAAGGETNLEFTSIPNTFRDLIVEASWNGTSASTTVGLRFNGNTSNIYNAYRTFGGLSNGGGQQVAQSMFPDLLASSGLDAANFMNATIEVTQYAATDRWKAIKTHAQFQDAGAINSGFVVLGAGKWKSTAAITDMNFILAAGTFNANSKITLYGR